jgi:hypothetical protein
MIHQKKFQRRGNRDGTHDSICMDCFTAIATAKRKADLDQHESAHVCEPVYRIVQGRFPCPPYSARAAISS